MRRRVLTRRAIRRWVRAHRLFVAAHSVVRRHGRCVRRRVWRQWRRRIAARRRRRLTIWRAWRRVLYRNLCARHVRRQHLLALSFHGWRQAWQRLLAGRDRVRRRALRRWQRELYLHRVVFAMSTLARRQVMLKAFLDWTTAWQGERRRSATVQAAATWRGRRCLFNVVRVAWPRFVQRMQRRRGRLFLADEHRRRQWWDRWANAFRRGRPHGRRHGAGRDKENVAAEPAHASSSKPPKRHPSAPLCPRVATVNVVAPEVILVGKDAEADVLDKSVIEFVGIEDDRAERGAPVQAVDDAQPSSMEAALDEAMLLAAEHARLAVERRHHLVWVAVCQRARQGRIRRAIHEQGTTLACFRAWRAALHLCREASNLFETFQVRRTRHLLRSWLRQVDVRRALLVIRRRIAIRAWRKARLHRQRLRRRALATWRAWAFPRRRTRRMRRLRLGRRVWDAWQRARAVRRFRMHRAVVWWAGTYLGRRTAAEARYRKADDRYRQRSARAVFRQWLRARSIVRAARQRRCFRDWLHMAARMRRWRHAMAAWLTDRALASRYGIPFVAPSIPYWYRERPRYKALASPFQAWRGFARSRSRRRRAEQHCVQGRTRRLLRAVTLLVRALRHDRRRAASLAFRFMLVRARARRFQKRVDRVFVRSWANHWRSTVRCTCNIRPAGSLMQPFPRYVSSALMRSSEPGPSASISSLGANFESVHQRNVCTRAPS
ncbi:hypothetical protein PBRA_002891 [Plasmodiophora brassicae]|uniref:Sfi1 spindle body domain-containing protein n=1 Tax=Plasmodiophora brassicae TaxID=37360 RepID=A0A0G4J6A7_PLABS|nr:hypothetical protein PBRA_002891 [Plasmodiophora brassicae]